VLANAELNVVVLTLVAIYEFVLPSDGSAETANTVAPSEEYSLRSDVLIANSPALSVVGIAPAVPLRLILIVLPLGGADIIFSLNF
jgi:hypothetical protein